MPAYVRGAPDSAPALNPVPGSAAGHSSALPLASLVLASVMWGFAWLPLHLLREAGIDGVVVTVLAFGTAGGLLLPLLWRFFVG